MKRHPHRKTKLAVGDQVYATTEILSRGPAVPLGTTGEVLATKGKVLDVQFVGHGIARVVRGQVRPVPTAQLGLPGLPEPVDEAATTDGQAAAIANPEEQPPAGPEQQAQPVLEAPPAPPAPAPTITINGEEVSATIVSSGRIDP